MIQDKREFGLGLGLMAGFFVILYLIFSPLHEGGRNTLDFLDNTFNSISKDAAYYIPRVMEKTKEFSGTEITVEIKASDEAQATRLGKILGLAEAKVGQENAKLTVTGNLGRILENVLSDADLMFKNDGAALKSKYDLDGRYVLYDWHQAFSAMTKDLNRQSKFSEGKILRDVQVRALEPAYNYFGVEAIPMSKMIWLAATALIGYVIYTVWYGFAVLFLFEGLGFKLKH